MKKITSILLGLFLAFAGIAQTPHWKYDFTAGSLVDLQGNYDFVQVGSALSTETDRFGYANNAISLNGDYLQGDHITSDNFTISFYMKSTTNEAVNRYLSENYNSTGYGYQMYLLNGVIKVHAKFGMTVDGNPYMASTPVALTSSTNVADGDWHHIVLTGLKTIESGFLFHYDYTLYVDGNQESSDRTSANLGPSSNKYHRGLDGDFSIGNTFAATADYYENQIDDISFFTSYLNFSQVNDLMNSRPAKEFYVNHAATGTNDGSSWTNAFTDLQAAITAADTENDEIWVAAGTYKPHSSDRAKHFNMNTGIKFYGGFAGTETTVSERDFRANETILSGDLAGDDDENMTYDNSTRDDNSYHVVKIAGENTFIDGFTITAGHSDDSDVDNARNGGGIFKEFSISTLNISNCNFEKNVSYYNAGIYAKFDAAGTHTVNISNSKFNNNSSKGGTAVAVLETAGTCNAEVSNCLFTNNYAGDNNTSVDSEGFAGSAVLFMTTAGTLDASLINSTVADNTDNGSHTSNNENSPIAVKRNNGTLNFTAVNNIFYSNTAAQTFGRMGQDNYPTSVTLSNNIRPDAATAWGGGTSNNEISTDPMLLPDYTLQTGSPGIDAGDNNFAVGTEDLAGHTRVDNSTIDLGAYEYCSACTYYTITGNVISGNGSISHSGESFIEGSTVTVEAIADAGWQFDSWGGDLAGNTNPQDIVMDANKTVAATFVIQPIVYIPDANFKAYLLATGAINTNGDAEIQVSEAAAFTGEMVVIANPISDFTGLEAFINLTKFYARYHTCSSIDFSSNTELTELSFPENEATAVTLPQTTTLTKIDISWNAITGDLDLSNYTNLERVELISNSFSIVDFRNGNNTNVINFDARINPNLTCILVDDASYSNSNWSTGLDAASTFLETDAECSVLTQYQLVTNISGSGNVTASPTGSSFDPATVVTLTATPNEGWEFTGWSGDLSGNINPQDITMNANKTVTATFTQLQQNLTINVTGSGNVTPLSGDFGQGSIVTLTATPDDGWAFDSWSGDLSGNTNPVDIVMDADKTVEAVFTQLPTYELQTSVTGSGQINLSPIGGTYSEGTTVTLTAIPELGWQFDSWSGDLSGNTNPTDVVMDADKTVEAVFTEIPVTVVFVDASATGNNDGTSWDDAFTDLSTALNAANASEYVWVAAGTYKPNASNRNASFVLRTDISVFGGFSGTELSLSERDFRANETILSGDLTGDDDENITYNNDTRDDNSYHVVVIAGDVSISCIIYITAGHSDDSDVDNARNGGGIFKEFTISTLNVSNCKFEKNVSYYNAGIFAKFDATGSHTVNIKNSIFDNNSSKGGTAVAVLSLAGTCEANVSNSLFVNNYAGDYPSSAGFSGSAILFMSDNAELTANLVNSTIADNTDNGNNGSNNENSPIAVKRNSGTLNFSAANNIFSANTASLSFGRMGTGNYPTSVTLSNNLRPDAGTAWGGGVSSNEISSNAMLDLDYYPQAGSSAIGAGENSFATGIPYDLAGNVRIFGTNIDIGCYENNTVGVERITENSLIVVFPNPAVDRLYLKSEELNISQIAIIEISGKVVKQSYLNQNSIDVSGLKPGVYVLVIKTEKGVTQKRFIKE